MIENILKDFYLKKYGPRFCKHCNNIQPVQIYELQGSHEYKIEDMIITETFMGNIFCRICHKEIEDKEKLPLS